MKLGEKGMEPSEACRVAEKMAAAGVVPMGTKVIITRDPPKTSEGLIHLPDQAQGSQLNGTVLAVGELVEEDLKPGDRISFTKYNMTKYEIPVGDEQVIVEICAPGDIYIRWRPWT